jgi:hypothetical protein
MPSHDGSCENLLFSCPSFGRLTVPVVQSSEKLCQEQIAKMETMIPRYGVHAMVWVGAWSHAEAAVRHAPDMIFLKFHYSTLTRSTSPIREHSLSFKTSRRQ